ncbi:MAG: adenylate/guanylate cyclase domain-containing protein [Oculatellaceae cyanobacterium bins.114]|nr:adenylate/guanylate cyclase domain-containing protein [Oculatellaceae cyanobacterium bins.114]
MNQGALPESIHMGEQQAVLKLYKQRRQIIAEALTALATYGVSSVIQGKMVTILDEHDARELYRFNPRLMATHLQIPEREMLGILVMGLKEGIFTLNWEIECPVCHSIDFRPKHLHDLRTLHTCPICHSIHNTDADEQVRVTFSVDERLRKLDPEADDLQFRARMDRRYGIVSGHRMLTLQTFRDLFPRETLPPSESLQIRRVAILFTDLAGSTALYTRRGDARAFDLVRQHFNLLFQLVNENNGVVVKTIGDAIMGAFTSPYDAMQAAIAMHRQLASLNQELALPPEDHLILKVGIDVGPCICVTLNDRPDYFGTTVNTAARVQATSTGNAIAITDTLANDSSVAGILQQCTWQRRDLLLKGLDASVMVHYIFPNATSERVEQT